MTRLQFILTLIVPFLTFKLVNKFYYYKTTQPCMDDPEGIGLIIKVPKNYYSIKENKWKENTFAKEENCLNVKFLYTKYEFHINMKQVCLNGSAITV